MYWKKVRSRLMSVVLSHDVLPQAEPTFFVTLSAADLRWPDLFLAMNQDLTIDQATNLPDLERRKLLRDHPHIAVEHFNRRLRAFFKHIVYGVGKPLGEVRDHFWRLEFQQRGSVHVHMLLWLKNAPDVQNLSQTSEGKEYLRKFIDTFISTDSELHDGECACKQATPEDANRKTLCAERDIAQRLARKEQRHGFCGPSSTCWRSATTCLIALTPAQSAT